MQNNSSLGLSYDRAVPRQLVHRRSISEVFITDVIRSGDDCFVAGAQWPRWHVFYGSSCRTYDSALLAETLRQVTILIAHTQLGVPLGTYFLLPDMSIARTGRGQPDSHKPTDVTVRARVTGVRKGKGGINGLRIQVEFWVEGVQIAEGSAGARIVDETSYVRLRKAAARPDPIPALSAGIESEHVGHSTAWNVVLGETTAARSWPLRVDVTNPIYFDHPLDHVPGALLIEAARQAIRAASGYGTLDVEAFSAVFSRIVELNDVTTVLLSDFTHPADGTTAATVKFTSSSGAQLAQIDVVFRRGADTWDDYETMPLGSEEPVKESAGRHLLAIVPAGV